MGVAGELELIEEMQFLASCHTSSGKLLQLLTQTGEEGGNSLFWAIIMNVDGAVVYAEGRTTC